MLVAVLRLRCPIQRVVRTTKACAGLPPPANGTQSCRASMGAPGPGRLRGVARLLPPGGLLLLLLPPGRCR